jgi:hypothetical protein
MRSNALHRSLIFSDEESKMNIGAGLHAKGTNVLIEKTVTDMEGQVYRFGGTDFRHDERTGHIWFRMDDPDFGWITIRIPMLPTSPRYDKERQRMYRTGFAYIKGTLVAIADGLLIPSKAFEAYIVDDDGTPLFGETRRLLMAKKPKVITCRYCHKSNRLPPDKDPTHAKCGHCHKPLTSNWKE